MQDVIRKLISKLHIHSEAKKKKKLNKKKRTELPDNVWNNIFDHLSPFEEAQMREVSHRMKNLVDDRRKRLMYLDVLRIDIGTIMDGNEDSDFYPHPCGGRVVIHQEDRAIVMLVDAHWTPRDAITVLGAIKYYGVHAQNVTLDASLAELCVAGQTTNDIGYWFHFQTAAGTSDPVSTTHTMTSASWYSERQKRTTVEDDQMLAYAQWNPRTQFIPFSPLFPKLREFTLRSSVPQLRRLRRFSIYRSPLKSLFDPNALSLFRLTITGGSSKKGQAPQALKLKLFNQWAMTSRLGNKYCVSFT